MNEAWASRPRLVVRTVRLRRGREALLGHLPATAPLAWLRRGDGMVAWGEAHRVSVGAQDDPGGTWRFTRAATELSELLAGADIDDPVGLPGTGPVAFGAFTFDPRSAGSALVVPRVIIGRRAGTTWLTTIGDTPDTHPDAILARVTPLRPVGPLEFGDGALSAAQWGDTVSTAVRRIRAGALAKVVLARDIRAHASAAGDSGIDVRTPLSRLVRDYPDCYTFCVDGMVGATPELLIRREGDRVSSLVLAGTRPRGAGPEEDARLAAELTSSGKEVEEHRYAIDSLREILAPLCSAVETPDRPRLMKVANVQHLASPARATLAPGVSTLDVLAAMHPTAAVGGTPTRAAMELIHELEGMDRGRYAAPVGWIDGSGNGEWGIALRCAEVDGARARLFAGGGIVAGSVPEAEIAETEAKFDVMRSALADGSAR